MNAVNLKSRLALFSLLVMTAFAIACEQPTATVSDLGKPLPTQAQSTPTPEAVPTPPKKVDPRRTDLSRVVVGKAAPDFVLEDSNRKKVHLSDFRGKQNVVLVFYRGFF